MERCAGRYKMDSLAQPNSSLIGVPWSVIGMGTVAILEVGAVIDGDGGADGREEFGGTPTGLATILARSSVSPQSAAMSQAASGQHAGRSAS